MTRMLHADTAESARQEGVAIGREIVERVRNMVAGVQLSAPLGPQSNWQRRSKRANGYTNKMATDLIEIDPPQPGCAPSSARRPSSAAAAWLPSLPKRCTCWCAIR